MRLSPYRDAGLVPNPGASLAAIALAEERLGRPLPPSYRAFLRSHDGWPRFFEGATLLGTANLGKRLYEDLARAAWEASETSAAELGPSRFAPRLRRPELVPFGVDLQATTLFAFDPARISADGECEVIAWVSEIGVRRESFTAFLEWILELCQSELQQHVEPAALLYQSA
jgi:hypothetical protein